MQQHQARRYTVGTWLQPRLSLCHGPPAKCARLDGDLSTPDMLLTLATSPQYEEMYPHVFCNNQTFASASGRNCYC
jgi:hypothetical protein